MTNRARRATIAEETISILKNGCYTHDGVEISITEPLRQAVTNTVLYRPEEIAALIDQPSTPADARFDVQVDVGVEVQVHNCTTFAAARALVDNAQTTDPFCLNFASAKNPGGGFLGGSQAQEEALSRASGLYHCLLTQEAYYQANRANRSTLYTDHMIYSPGVPVFRDDEDQLLAAPVNLSILTAPAPNAGAVRRNQPEDVDEILPTMRRRIDGVLAVAEANQHRELVLGAWGCGVFGNEPVGVAQQFAEALAEPRFAGAFNTIVFAVLDRSKSGETYEAFAGAVG